jgi:hypothetical protein
MSERMDRRQVIRKLGATAAVPFLSGFHPSVPPQQGEWTPLIFQGSEAETVAHLAERILPETDTPGARRALVHQYIDFVLAKGEAADRHRFREGLVSLDRSSADRFGKPFAELEPPRQDEILTGISESPFFRELKRLTVDGYYRSEVGMKQELGFEGNAFLAEFEGCTHPEHHSWSIDGAGRGGGEPGEEHNQAAGPGGPRPPRAKSAGSEPREEHNQAAGPGGPRPPRAKSAGSEPREERGEHY